MKQSDLLMVGTPGRSGGRNRKSNEVKRREGNRGHRRILCEPHAVGEPKCPEFYSAEAQALWQATIAAIPAGLVTAADQGAMERFVGAWATLRRCDRQLAGDEAELVTITERGRIRNPLVVIRRQAGQEMSSAGNDLGLSPFARSRLSVPQPADDDPMELLLRDVEDGSPWSTVKRQ